MKLHPILRGQPGPETRDIEQGAQTRDPRNVAAEPTPLQLTPPSSRVSAGALLKLSVCVSATLLGTAALSLNMPQSGSPGSGIAPFDPGEAPAGIPDFHLGHLDLTASALAPIEPVLIHTAPRPPVTMADTIGALYDSGVRNFFLTAQGVYGEGEISFDPGKAAVLDTIFETVTGHREKATFYFYQGKPADQEMWDQHLNASVWQDRVRFVKLNNPAADSQLEAMTSKPGVDVAAVSMKLSFGFDSRYDAGNSFNNAMKNDPSALLIFNDDIPKLDWDYLMQASDGASIGEMEVPGRGKLTFVAKAMNAAPLRKLAAQAQGLKWKEGLEWHRGATAVFTPEQIRASLASADIAVTIANYRRAGVRKTLFGEVHGSSFNMETVARIVEGLRQGDRTLQYYQEGWPSGATGHMPRVQDIITMHRANGEAYWNETLSDIEATLFQKALADERAVHVHSMQFLNPDVRDFNAFIDTDEEAFCWVGLSHALSVVTDEDYVDESWAGISKPQPEIAQYRIAGNLTGDARAQAARAQRDLYDGLRRSLARCPSLLVINTQNFDTQLLKALRTHLRHMGLSVRSERFDGSDGFGYTLDFATTGDIHAKIDAMERREA